MASLLDCKKVQNNIGEYVDGALRADAAWDVRLHLQSCAVCTKVAEELNATAGLLRSLPALEPSASFEAALAARLADQALRPRRPSLRARFSEWWAGVGTAARLHPALATTAALAVFAPLALLLVRPDDAPSAPAPRPAGTVVARSDRGGTSAAADPALEEMWREHSAYAASEPLADPAGMLPSRNAATAAAPDLSL